MEEKMRAYPRVTYPIANTPLKKNDRLHSKAYNLFFNQSAMAKFKRKVGEFARSPEGYEDSHNPLPEQIQSYLLEHELLSTNDFIELNSLVSNDAIFNSPFEIGFSSVDGASLNTMIRGFNRNQSRLEQSGNKNILIYYYSDPKQLNKLISLAQSFKGYQVITILSHGMYDSNSARGALLNTLLANKNIGLVLVEGNSKIPAFKMILKYICLDAKLEDYCEKRNEEPMYGNDFFNFNQVPTYFTTFFNFFGFWFPKPVKIAAATTLQNFMRGEATMKELKFYLKVLSQGRLGKIYDEYLEFNSAYQAVIDNTVDTHLGMNAKRRQFNGK